MRYPIYNHYTRLVLRLCLMLVTMLGFAAPALGQTYPVQVNVYIAPPHGKTLSDYYSTTREKLVVSLLSRDQQKPLLEVRLRMAITASNGLKIQSKEETNYPVIELDAGVPVRLTQDDLAPYFLNINSQGYLDKGKLPDGLVEFTFTVVEKYTGKVLSLPATGRVWLSSQKPPLLRLPSNDENVAFRDPLNLKFQWEPQHKNLSQVEYEFELRELPDFGAAPQSAFLYAPVILSERTLYTYLLYTAIMPPLDPDKLYGWRVQAVAKDGVDEINLFENGGYSEIRWFRTTSSCLPPTNLAATVKGRTIDFSWLPEPGHIGSVLQFRPKYGTALEDWQSIETPENRTSIYNAKLGTIYEYRAGGMCAPEQTVFSGIKEITVPMVDSARLAKCGMMPDIDFDNKEPLSELKPGDVVMLADFPMTVTKTSGSGGQFSGQGWVPVNWLINTSWAVEFSNITVNTDYRMIAGMARAMYDENESNIAKLDDIFEGGRDNTKNGITRSDITLDFTFPDHPVLSYNPQTREITVYTTDGQQAGTFTLPPGEGKEVFPVTVTDDKGNIYRIEETQSSGEMDENGEPAAPALNAVYLGKQEDPLPSGSFSTKAVDNTLAVVTFNKGTGVYAFDTFDKRYFDISKVAGKYEHLAVGSDRYDVPWKFLPVGGSDVVKAALDIKAKDFDPLRVVFRTSQGTVFRSEYDEKERAFTVHLIGGEHGDVQEVYALYRLSSAAYATLGKLGVVSYTKQTQQLVIVRVKGYGKDISGIDECLKEIYAPVGVDWQVRMEDFNYDGDLSDFFEKKSGLLTSYNTKMKALQAAYRVAKGIDSKACYLFILEDSGVQKNRDTQGFMPRGGQFGYIFEKNLSAGEICGIIAHELAHGRWRLRHTFDDTYGGVLKSGTTDNLMDYANARHIAKWQWDQIYDPAWVTSPFEGDEAGMSKKDSDTIISNLMNALKAVGENGCAFFKSQRTVSSHIEIKLSEETTYTSYLIGEYKNGLVSFDTAFESKETVEQNNLGLLDGLIDSDKNFVLYVEKGEIKYCEAVEDYSAFHSLIEARNDPAFLKKYTTDLLRCKSDYEKKYITSILTQLQASARPSQQIEFSYNGNNYILKNGEVQSNTLSDEQITAGQWTESDKDTRIRYFINSDGIIQIKAFGFRNNLPLEPAQADLRTLANHIKEKSNGFLSEYKVMEFDAIAPLFTNNKETFADGEKITIGHLKASFLKIISEGIGVTTTMLKTGEIEEQVYTTSAKDTTVIHMPGLLSGSFVVVAHKITDITSLGCLVYDVAFDKDVRSELCNQFAGIKDQIADDPLSFFPILGEILLTVTTDNTSDDWLTLFDENADAGKRSHIGTKGTGIAIVSAVTGATIITKFPEVGKKLADWVKKTVASRNKLRKIIDMNAGKAYLRKYFDNVVKKGSFDEWYEKAKRYELGKDLNFEAHHVIPESVFKDNSKLQGLLHKFSSEFDFNGIDNGIPLPKKKVGIDLSGHASHPQYNRAVEKRITEILDKNPIDRQAMNKIKEFVENTKKILEEDVLLGLKDVNSITSLPIP